MKKCLLIIFILPVLISCAHCSKTLTTFVGKTKGFNPYGDGSIKIVRYAYWGEKACIFKLVDETIRNKGIAMSMIDLEGGIEECECNGVKFLCPEKALADDIISEWGQFCSCYEECSEEAQEIVKEGLMAQEEVELNCADYCASYADETDGHSDEGI